MMYDLPTTAEICGKKYEIRSDYRAALDILTCLTDPELTPEERTIVALDIFYPDMTSIPENALQAAIDYMVWFLNCGDEGDNRKRPKLMDWEQDFQYIVAPINRVIGQEVRAMPYLHFWTFISAYYELGDCMFAQIVRIRNLKAKGKKLDKADQEFYRENRRLIDIKQKYTEADDLAISKWI